MMMIKEDLIKIRWVVLKIYAYIRADSAKQLLPAVCCFILCYYDENKYLYVTLFILVL
jgi:hypothetical protein